MSAVCVLIGILFFISVIVGWGQGLFRVVLSFAALVVSLVLSIYVSPKLSGVLQEKTQIDERIATTISQQLEYSETGEEVKKSVQVAIINELPLPETLKDNMLNNNNSEMYDLLDVTGVYDYISKSLAIVVLNTSVFLALLITSRIGFFLLERSADELTKLPIVRSVDKIGGGCFGVARGLLWMWLLFLVLSITSTFQFSADLISQINDNMILSFLYNHNIFIDIIADLTKILF